jgi:L-ascorbate metabolism protein UlaG (beta-lactamase superfamily)
MRELKHGLVLNWLVQAPGASVVHIDSADFIDDELRGHSCDVLCLCAIGRAARPRYVADAVALLKPRFVIPCHWDWFFSPLDAPARLLPGVDLGGMIREIRDAGATPVVLPFLGQFGLG